MSEKLPPRRQEVTDQSVDACVNSKVLESALVEVEAGVRS